MGLTAVEVAGHGGESLYSQPLGAKGSQSSEFEANQGYLVRLCLKKKQTLETRKNI